MYVYMLLLVFFPKNYVIRHVTAAERVRLWAAAPLNFKGAS